MSPNEFVTFLNQNSGALTVLFTAVVTLSTVVYAALTAVLVFETKKMRLVQTEPKIQIQLNSLEFAISLIRLNIKNIGLGPAKNVKFNCKVVSGNEDAQSLLEEFTNTNFLKNGLSYLGPSQEIHSRCTSMKQGYEGKIKSVLEFKVSYQNASGKQYKDIFLIDIAEMGGMQKIGKPYLYSIAESLETINKNLEYLTTGFKKLQIDIFTSKDREKEYQEYLKEIEEPHSNKKK